MMGDFYFRSEFSFSDIFAELWMFFCGFFLYTINNQTNKERKDSMLLKTIWRRFYECSDSL